MRKIYWVIMLVLVFGLTSSFASAFEYDGQTCSVNPADYHHYNATADYSYSGASDTYSFNQIATNQDVTIFLVNYTRDYDAADQPFDFRSGGATIIQEFTWDCSSAGGAEFCIRNGVSLVDTNVVSSAGTLYNYSATYDQNIEANNISIWSGAIQSDFLNRGYRNSADLGQITVESSAGTTSFDSVYIWNGTAGCPPVAQPETLSLTAVHEWDLSALNSFSAYYTNNGTLIGTTTNGTINSDINTTIGATENITFEATDFFNKTYFNYDPSNDLEAQMFQAVILLEPRGIANTSLISGGNFTIGSRTIQNGDVLNISVGNYTALFTHDNFVSTSFDFSVSALDNVVYNVSVGNSILSINAYDIVQTQSINNFTINISGVGIDYSGLSTTTGGQINFSLDLGYNYSFFIDAEGYEIKNATKFVDNTWTNYTFELFTTNSVNFEFRNEITNELVTENISLEFISDLVSYNFTTSNGSLYVDLLEPTNYRVRYQADNYGLLREYYLTITEDTSTTYNLFLIPLTNSSETKITVYDDSSLDPLTGAIVVLQRYYQPNNEYRAVAMYTTDSAGIAYFDIQQDEELYKFLIYQPLNNLLFASEGQYVFETALSLYVSVIGDSLQDVFNYLGVDGTITYSDALQEFTASYSDPAGAYTQYCLSLKKYGQYSNVVLNETCSSSPSGSLIVSGISGNVTHYAVLVGKIGGSQTTLASLWQAFPAFELDAGQQGLFLTVMVVMILGLLAGIGFYGLIFSVLGLVFSKMLQIVNLSWELVIGTAILYLIVGLIVENKK